MRVRVSPVVTTLVWDLDGTLLDSFGIFESVLNEVLTRRGRPIPLHEIFLKNHHGRLEDSMRAVLGEETSPEELAEILKEFLELDNVFIKNVDDHLHADGVALARQAHRKGLRQVIVTNRAHGVDRGLASPRNMVTSSALNEFISDLVCGDETELGKPHPAVLQPLFNDLLFNPEEILVIGDQFVDAQFAHNMGAHGVIVQRHDELAHMDKLTAGWEDGVHIVRSLHEVTF